MNRRMAIVDAASQASGATVASETPKCATEWAMRARMRSSLNYADRSWSWHATVASTALAKPDEKGVAASRQPVTSYAAMEAAVGVKQAGGSMMDARPATGSASPGELMWASAAVNSRSSASISSCVGSKRQAVKS